MTSDNASSARQDPEFEVSTRAMFAIAVPMTLGYLTTPLLGLVDTGVIGRFGDAAMLGGLAAGAVIIDLIMASFNFLRMGTTGLVAQAVGRKDKKAQGLIFWRAMLLAGGIGATTWLLIPFAAPLGNLIIHPDADVLAAMTQYLTIRLISTPAALGNYAVLGFVLGRGEAKTGLLLQVIINGTNILLSIALGLGLGWGIAGVAWGTVTAELTGLAAGLMAVRKSLGTLQLPDRNALFARQEFLRMLNVNRDIMIRSFCLLGTFTLFTRFGAQFGKETLAANAVLINFLLLAGYVLDGMAVAAEQFTGQALGARLREHFVRAVKLALICGLVLAAIVSLMLYGFGTLLIALLTVSPETRVIAGNYMIWAALTPLAGVAAFQLDGVYIGATWTSEMRNTLILSMLAFVVAWAVLTPVIHNHGLWLALLIFLQARGGGLAWLLPKKIASAFD